jgi:SNF2 family DNA or RNA helicase
MGNFAIMPCINILFSMSKAKTSIGGCILAHNMGLGKSLSCVALLHALFHHPSLKSSGTTRRLVHTVLLVVPVNTLANWENEFDKWTGSMRNARLEVCNLVNVLDRRRAIERWGNSVSDRPDFSHSGKEEAVP